MTFLLSAWSYGSIAEFNCLPARCNRVFGGFSGGWMDVRADVLRGVLMYVSVRRCVDV